jgi:hypothetical protein
MRIFCIKNYFTFVLKVRTKMEINNKDISRPKIYIISQLIIDVLFIISIIVEKKITEYTGAVLFISILLWGILHQRTSLVISMYLKENNSLIYNKYMGWRFAFNKKYGTIATINGCKLKEDDLKEIADKRIIQMLKISCLSRKVVFISSIGIVLFAVIMSIC